MFNLGVWEILLLLFFGLVLFGSSLPAAARYLGRTARDVRKEVDTLKDDFEESINKPK